MRVFALLSSVVHGCCRIDETAGHLLFELEDVEWSYHLESATLAPIKRAA